MQGNPSGNQSDARVQESIDFLANGGHYLRGGSYVQFTSERILLGNGDLMGIVAEMRNQKPYGGMNVAVVDQEGRIYYGLLENILAYGGEVKSAESGVKVRIPNPDGCTHVERDFTGLDVAALFRLNFTGVSFPQEWLDGRGT